MKLNCAYFLMLCTFTIIYAKTCTFRVGDRPPLFVKSSVQNDPMFANPNSKITFHEIITAYCPSRVRVWNEFTRNYEHFGDMRRIDITCRNDNIASISRLMSRMIRFDLNKTIIFCDEHSMNSLYESKKHLPDCLSDMNYGIGNKCSQIGEYPKVGLCYDLKEASLKYMHYLAHQPSLENIFKNKIFNFTKLLDVTLDIEMRHIEPIVLSFDKSDFETAAALQQASNPLLDIFQFEYANIIQSSDLKADLNEIGNIRMLNIVWWRNLIEKNWKYFVDALTERSKMVNYNVYTGTSGVLSVPSNDSSNSEPLIFNVNDVRLKTPEYIWSYLKSIDENVSEEFVAIGFNNPFQQLQMTNICKDMCNEIDWLQGSTFGRIRLMPIFGVVICCRVEEVAHKLDNFPISVIKTPESTTIPLIEH